MNTNKANSMLRRFFSRVGGGGTKSLNYKVTMKASEPNSGGDAPSDEMSLGQALIKVLSLDTSVYGIPDLVILTGENEGVFDGAGIISQSFDTPINIGMQTVKKYYVCEDESRYKDFKAFTWEDVYSRGEYPNVLLAYKLSTVQNLTPEDGYAYVSYGQIDTALPSLDGYTYVYSNTNASPIIHKYNDEYYVIFVNYG